MVSKNPYWAVVPSFARSPGINTESGLSATTFAATTVGGGFAPAPGCMSATMTRKSVCRLTVTDVATTAATTVDPVCMVGAGTVVTTATTVGVAVAFPLVVTTGVGIDVEAATTATVTVSPVLTIGAGIVVTTATTGAVDTGA